MKKLVVTVECKIVETPEPRKVYRAIAGKIFRGLAKVRASREWPEYRALVEARGIEVASG